MSRRGAPQSRRHHRPSDAPNRFHRNRPSAEGTPGARSPFSTRAPFKAIIADYENENGEIPGIAEHDEPCVIFCVHDANAAGSMFHQTFQEGDESARRPLSRELGHFIRSVPTPTGIIKC